MWSTLSTSRRLHPFVSHFHQFGFARTPWIPQPSTGAIHTISSSYPSPNRMYAHIHAHTYSSPKRRTDTDVMKLQVLFFPILTGKRQPGARTDPTRIFVRLMSDYEVNLVNDSMSEFFVKFYGPSESTSSFYPLPCLFLTEGGGERADRLSSTNADSWLAHPYSPVRIRLLEDSRRTPYSIPVQES
jgi:hypothetical protein